MHQDSAGTLWRRKYVQQRWLTSPTRTVISSDPEGSALSELKDAFGDCFLMCQKWLLADKVMQLVARQHGNNPIHMWHFVLHPELKQHSWFVFISKTECASLSTALITLIWGLRCFYSFVPIYNEKWSLCCKIYELTFEKTKGLLRRGFINVTAHKHQKTDSTSSWNMRKTHNYTKQWMCFFSVLFKLNINTFLLLCSDGLYVTTNPSAELHFSLTASK